jgi:hypothetical protein
MIKEVTTYILDEIGVAYWERDETFFAGHIPINNKSGEDVATMVRFAALLETAGSVIPDLKDRADQTFQILNYHRSYFGARDDAWAFYDLLHSSSQCDLPIIGSGNQLSAYIINAIGTPAPIENPDDKGRFVFSTNYLWMIGYR